MSLADPTAKMGKSQSDDAAGTVFLLDPADVVRRKVLRAVTDSDVGPSAVRRERPAKPGVTNLIEILEACGGTAEDITTYGVLKRTVADAVIATLEPIQKAYADLDPAEVTAIFDRGAARCREVTEPVLAAAQAAMGLG
jgi:tryptophanyl-tRNA synthetase